MSIFVSIVGLVLLLYLPLAVSGKAMETSEGRIWGLTRTQSIKATIAWVIAAVMAVMLGWLILNQYANGVHDGHFGEWYLNYAYWTLLLFVLFFSLAHVLKAIRGYY